MFCHGACCDEVLTDERQLSHGALILHDKQARRVALILAFAQGLVGIHAMTIFTLSGIIGIQLAPSDSYATLPITLYTLGILAALFPASWFMRYLGRRAGFMLGAYLGVVGSVIAVYAIYEQNFSLFCWSMVLNGFYQSFAQFYRYAAADSASSGFRPTAISWVLAGGLISAFFGAQVISNSKDLFSPILYAGSFVASAVVSMLALIVLAFLKLPKLAVEVEAKEGREKARSLHEMLQDKRLLLAILIGVVSHAIMMFAMTTTPIAMVACGHNVSDATTVIQWHLAAMYAPSFLTGKLVTRFGAEKIISVGLLLLCVAAAISLSGVEIAQFLATMLMIGVGWNFSFIGATAIVTASHKPQEAAGLQAFNELSIYGGVAIMTFLSGVVYAQFGNSGANYTLLILLLFAILLFIILIKQEKYTMKEAMTAR